MKRIPALGLLLSLLPVVCVPIAEGATVPATSCSLQDVQAAVNRASDGDVVTIPNGSCAWSGGISTSKQIRIQAENYVPTKGGTLNRNVTLTNNSGSPLFSLASGSTFHVGIGGIRFNEGSGNGNHIRLSGTGSKVPLVYDCAFEIKSRFGNNPDIAAVAVLSQGGVIWNASFRSSETNGVDGASLLITSPRSWQTASTMGSLDVSGAVNVYVEDSTAYEVGQFPDVDDNGRFVMRYSNLDGSWGITHGFTSGSGGRHFEYYNNIFSVTDANRNLARRYFWIRAGTGIFTENVVNSASNPQEWGNPVLFQIGDNTSPGSYPMARQPGWGHDGSKSTIDPIYAWNNTGGRASSWDYQYQPGGWEKIVLAGREVFVDAGAKPGYAKFTYPHPARSAVEDGVAKPMAPAGVSVQ